jgi:hypothetical protein
MAPVYRTPPEPTRPSPPPRQTVGEFALLLLAGAVAVLAIHMAFRWALHRERSRARRINEPVASASPAPLRRTEVVAPAGSGAGPSIVIPLNQEGVPTRAPRRVRGPADRR